MSDTVLAAPRSPARLLPCVLALLVAGLLLVISGANTPAAGRWGRTPVDYTTQQLGCALLGLGLAAGVLRLGRVRLLRLATPLALGLLGLSILTLVPGVGVPFGGARRQIDLFGLVFQPTILWVGALPLLLAACWGEGRLRDPYPWVVAGLGGVVCLAQPNFGHLGTLLVTLIGALAGVGARRPLLRVSALFLACGPLALCFPYVRWRLASFLAPGLTRDTQALVEIAGQAGTVGLGLGQGVEKSLLSAAPTDYMFAVALEELGWLGALGLLGLLASVCLSTWREGARGDLAARAAAGGVVAFVAFPALVHVAVSLRLFPVTGIHLPLVSYSGSAVVAVLFALSSAAALARPEHR